MRKARLRYWAEIAFFRFALFTLAVPPRRIAERIGRLYGGILDRAVPRLRHIGRRNLQLALPELSPDRHEWILDGVFENIGRVLTAFARFPSINPTNVHQWIRCEGQEHFAAAKTRGKGVLFATAHLGNWELSAFAHAYITGPMHVVVRPLDNPYADQLVETRRALSGNTISGKHDAARTILRALKNNQAVGILIDQNTLPDQGVFVPFFGHLACTHTTFAKLALRTGAAVLPGYALWSAEERRYVLHFDAPLELPPDLTEASAMLAAHFEAVIRKYPDQWLWIHRRWKTRPPGEAPIY